MVPQDDRALARAIGLAHARPARRLNASRGWTGHLWANRFFSTALDESHLWTEIRTIELNPVRAGLAAQAVDWSWSSARVHALGEPDPLLNPARPSDAGARDGLTGRFISWGDRLTRSLAEGEAEALRLATRTGRPCGVAAFVKAWETALARPLVPQKCGMKPKTEDDPPEISGLF